LTASPNKGYLFPCSSLFSLQILIQGPPRLESEPSPRLKKTAGQKLRRSSGYTVSLLTQSSTSNLIPGRSLIRITHGLSPSFLSPPVPYNLQLAGPDAPLTGLPKQTIGLRLNPPFNLTFPPRAICLLHLFPGFVKVPLQPYNPGRK